MGTKWVPSDAFNDAIARIIDTKLEIAMLEQQCKKK